MKHLSSIILGSVLVVFIALGALAQTSGEAQDVQESIAESAAELTAESPVTAEQESRAAFEEANATANPAVNSTESGELGQEAENATAQTPSYGSFLDQKQEEPTSTNIMDTGEALVSSVFSTAAYLCLILGIIFFGFWLLRKFGPNGIARGTDMVNPQLVGRAVLGPKKHVDVIRVQGRTLLLGVTEENIRLITELENQPGQCFDEEDEDDFTDFTEMLGKQVREADDADSD